METNQTFINQFVDDNYEAILDRLATKMQEASEIPVVDYNSLKHQAVLMQYVWEDSGRESEQLPGRRTGIGDSSGEQG